MTQRERILADIHDERERQTAKWGVQVLSPGDWACVLGEEFGEVCTELQGLSDRKACRAELIQVAAVAVQMIEAIEDGRL